MRSKGGIAGRPGSVNRPSGPVSRLGLGSWCWAAQWQQKGPGDRWWAQSTSRFTRQFPARFAMDLVPLGPEEPWKRQQKEAVQVGRRRPELAGTL